MPLGQEMGDAVSDDARFTRTGAGQDEQRRPAMDHRLALGIV
jgi:hypothetical protein